METTPTPGGAGGFAGIFPYLVSPVDGAGRVEEAALRRLIGHLLDAGVHGVSPLGSTGEVMYLTPSEREAIVKITLDEVAGRVPVVPGVAAFASRDAARQTEEMTTWGADGIVAIQQVYGAASTPVVVDYFSAIAGATNLPVVLYTNPRLGADIPLDALEQLVDHDNIQYMKDASGVTGKLLAIQSRLGDRIRFFAASAHIPTAVFDLGGVGWMAGPACVAPAASVALWEAHLARDWGARERLQRALWPLNDLFTRHALARLVKLALDEAGFPVGAPIPPQAPVSDEVRPLLRDVLARIADAIVEVTETG